MILQIQPGLAGAILSTRKTIPSMFRWNSAFQQYRERGTQGATSPLWISVSVSLAFDKWDGRRWRREGNVLKQKWEGGWKRGILGLDVMHASVCVHCVAQVSGFYLSEGKHWGMHTSGQMQILRPRCKSHHVLQSTCVYVSDRDKVRCSMCLWVNMWEYFIVLPKKNGVATLWCPWLFFAQLSFVLCMKSKVIETTTLSAKSDVTQVI